METSILIAQILSITYLSVGIGFLISDDYYKKDFLKGIDNPSMLYLGAVMAIIVGMLITHHHDVWTKDWRVIITLIGWIATIKGVILLTLPNSVKMFRGLFKPQYLPKIGVLVLIIGLVFGYFGFIA